MAEEKTQGEEKDMLSVVRRATHWKGLLADDGKKTRQATLAALLVASAALTLMHLGISDDWTGYALGLIAPVTTIALLLGTKDGIIGGTASGTMLAIHATLQPTDMFEAFCVNIANTALPLAIMGGLSAPLLALALIGDPKGMERRIRIAVPCTAAALATTSVLSSVTSDITLSVNALSPSASPVTAYTLMGSTGLQCTSGALIAILSALLADELCRQAHLPASTVPIKASLRSKGVCRLALAFLVATSVSVSAITASLEARATADMETRNARIMGELSRGYDATGRSLSWDTAASDAIRAYNLDGDGMVAVILDGTVIASNGRAWPVGTETEDVLPASTLNGSTGGTARILYSDTTDRELRRLDGKADAHAQLGQATVSATTLMGGHTIRTASAMPDSLILKGKGDATILALIALTALMAGIGILADRMLDQSVTAPIWEMEETLGRITDGDLDETMRVDTSSELAGIADATNIIVRTLKNCAIDRRRRMEATRQQAQGQAQGQTLPSDAEGRQDGTGDEAPATEGS